MKDLQVFKDSMQGIVDSVDNLHKMILIADEKDADKFLQDCTYKENVLLVTYPSSNTGNSNEDNITEQETIIIWILSSLNDSDYTNDKLFDLMHDSQVITAEVKQLLVEGAIYDGNINLSTDPEPYAFKNNWRGYMIIANYNTKGFLDESTGCN